jgi:hypothetical protein
MRLTIPAGRNARAANNAVAAVFYNGAPYYDFAVGDCVVHRFTGHRGIVQEIHGFRVRVGFENNRTGSVLKGALRPARPTDSL